MKRSRLKRPFWMFGFWMVKSWVFKWLDHSKTDLQNVQFSNGFGIRMFGIRAPTVIGQLVFVSLLKNLNLGSDQRSPATSLRPDSFRPDLSTTIVFAPSCHVSQNPFILSCLHFFLFFSSYNSKLVLKNKNSHYQSSRAIEANLRMLA